MNNIYDIYERLYNGILAPMDDTIERGEEDAQIVLSTYKEKLIKIVTLAGGLNDNESDVFRQMIDDSIKESGTTTAKFCIDKKVRDSLIACSGKKLKNADFSGFYFDTKEYNRQCSTYHVYFDYEIGHEYGGVDTLLRNAKKSKNVFIEVPNVTKTAPIRAIYTGNNTYIIQQLHTGMIYIKIRNMFRLTISINDRGSTSDRWRFDLNHSTI